MTIERTQHHMYELNTEARLTRLEMVNESILRALERIDKKIDDKIDGLEKRLDKIDLRLDRIDLRIDKIESRLWQIMLLIATPIVAAILGKIFHWF
jgi:chromosome segregation ATPase